MMLVKGTLLPDESFDHATLGDSLNWQCRNVESERARDRMDTLPMAFHLRRDSRS